MWNEIAAWQEQLNLRPDLSAKTIALYTQDVRRFATWLQQRTSWSQCNRGHANRRKSLSRPSACQTLCPHDHQSCTD